MAISNIIFMETYGFEIVKDYLNEFSEYRSCYNSVCVCMCACMCVLMVHQVGKYRPGRMI